MPHMYVIGQLSPFWSYCINDNLYENLSLDKKQRMRKRHMIPAEGSSLY